MKRLIIAAFALGLISTPAMAQSVYVKPYFKSDGTYVPGHWRSKPNGTVYDNYSTYPNINPYTGERAQRQRTQPTYPVYPRTHVEPSSPLPPRTQERWQKTMPLTCKYSDLC